MRGGVLCHGRLYVAVSRTASREHILCLVKPERMIDGIPHVHNVVCPELIEAATGNTPPSFCNPRKHKTGNNYTSDSGDPDTESDTQSEKTRATTTMMTSTMTTTSGNGIQYLRLAMVRVYFDAFQGGCTTHQICTGL